MQIHPVSKLGGFEKVNLTLKRKKESPPKNCQINGVFLDPGQGRIAFNHLNFVLYSSFF
jgi:hypothetical protein